MTTPYQVGESIPISLSVGMLPLYAGRTVMRMLIAMMFSLLFTFTFATWAAKSHRAERLIIPMIDVLQSVPILGFLSVTVVGFIALFPGSLLGPECATIFVIFTSQAWNMALGFYQTLRSVPAEMEEAGRMFHLSAWQRFWRIEVPFSMPGLLWNMMVSMSAGWFFVVAAEAINVSNQQILLPGIGSYIATAINAANMQAIVYAIITMLIVIVIYDQLLFRPLVAWAEKFKSEQHASEKMRESWVIDFFRRTRMMRLVGVRLSWIFDAIVNVRFLRLSAKSEPSTVPHLRLDYLGDKLWSTIVIAVYVGVFCYFSIDIVQHVKSSEIPYVFLLGLITACRVFVLIILCSLLWVPVGIWLGLRPAMSSIAQPIAQILAAFPANLLYPFVVVFIVANHLNPNIWLTPLILLGSQWYILFNVIAGASTIPKELIQVADNLGVVGWLRWSRLLLPGILPYYITGAITAAGGGWNASIVAEVASWGNQQVEADGLGAYITHYTTTGDFIHVALGIGMMCILVLILNRLLWRPLYEYAEKRFVLE